MKYISTIYFSLFLLYECRRHIRRTYQAHAFYLHPDVLVVDACHTDKVLHRLFRYGKRRIVTIFLQTEMVTIMIEKSEIRGILGKYKFLLEDRAYLTDTPSHEATEVTQGVSLVHGDDSLPRLGVTLNNVLIIHALRNNFKKPPWKKTFRQTTKKA